MRLLQVSNYLYPHIGGIEQVARDIAASLADREDIEQKIICFNETASDKDYTCKRSETVLDTVDGIEVVRCGCFAKIASQSLSLSYPRELYRLLREFDPDVVIFHYPNPFVASFLFPMLKKNVKVITFWHLDITKQKILGKLFSHQSLSICKRSVRLIPASPNYVEGSPFLSRFREKCTVIPDCIVPERLEITPRVTAKAEHIRKKFGGRTVVFACGRHVEYKGLIYLVKAAKHLGDDFEILIGGKGPLTGQLFKEAGSDRRIHMLGRIADETLAACMLACDIFAFPSVTRNEAFGIALAEAMYFSKPAVTYTIKGSGVNFVSLDGVTGIECKNSDSKALAEAIETLADDKELREKYGRAARQRVEDNFLFGTFRKNIIALIDSI